MEHDLRTDGARSDRTAPPVSVYVVNDHEHVRMTLVEYIDAAAGFRVIGSSGAGADGIIEIVRLQPRIAVVDGRLARGTGLDVCRDLGAAAPKVSCVILTSALPRSWGPVDAAEAGAAAFVVKRLRNFELIEMMIRVANGERPIDDDERQARHEAAAGQVEGAHR